MQSSSRSAASRSASSRAPTCSSTSPTSATTRAALSAVDADEAEAEWNDLAGRDQLALLGRVGVEVAREVGLPAEVSLREPALESTAELLEAMEVVMFLVPLVLIDGIARR